MAINEAAQEITDFARTFRRENACSEVGIHLGGEDVCRGDRGLSNFLNNPIHAGNNELYLKN